MAFQWGWLGGPALAVLAVAAPALLHAGSPGAAKADRLLELMDASPRVARDPRLERLPKPRRRELQCLALAVYHESRGEIAAGRYAVAHVVQNRADRDGSTFCATVFAPFQFSFTAKPAKALLPVEADAWRRSLAEAGDVALHGMRDITDGATNFYAHRQVTPVWSKRAAKAQTIGNHRFLRLSSGYAMRVLPTRSLDTWTL